MQPSLLLMGEEGHELVDGGVGVVVLAAPQDGHLRADLGAQHLHQADRFRRERTMGELGVVETCVGEADQDQFHGVAASKASTRRINS